MKLSNPYLRLMRLHQPVGIWLLFWPCSWSLVLAFEQSDEKKLILFLILFFLGAVLMRGAGCVINDIVDRNIDRHVERTKNRPLANGELTIKQAIVFLAILLFGALMIAILLGWAVVMWGALALFPVFIYPFMKRISWWPQLFLGLAFNWGVFMGWVALRGQIELPVIFLYIGGVCLTIGYDTIYAHQDIVDDKRMQVRSTALRLKDNTKIFVALMYALAITCFALATGNLWGVLAFIPAALHCVWQLYYLNIYSPESARKMFLSNSWLGMLVFLGLFLSILSK